MDETQEHAIAAGDDLPRVRLAIFTEELFATGHDAANRAAVKAVRREDLRVVAIAFRAERKAADKITKDLALHR